MQRKCLLLQKPADDKQTEPAEPCEVLLDQADSRAEDVVIEPLLLAEAERIAEKAEPEEPTEQVIERGRRCTAGRTHSRET